MRFAAELQSDLREIRTMSRDPEPVIIAAGDTYYWAGLEYWKSQMMHARDHHEIASDLDYLMERTRPSGQREIESQCGPFFGRGRRSSAGIACLS